MPAEEMLRTVQSLKEKCIANGFQKTEEVDIFFIKNWMQILDILDDTLYEYLNRCK